MPPYFRQVKHEPLNLPKPDRLSHLPAADEAVRRELETRRVILTPAQKAMAARKAAVPAQPAQPIAEQTAPSEPEPPQPQPALALVAAPAASVPAAAAMPAKSKSKSKRGARLPDDWFLPMAWGEWAVREKGMTPEAVRMEAEKFSDYWHARAGEGATKCDWQATWRNWIRRACEQGAGGARATSSRPQRSTAADYLRVVQEIHERNRPYLENDEEENDDEENRRQMA